MQYYNSYKVVIQRAVILANVIAPYGRAPLQEVSGAYELLELWL